MLLLKQVRDMYSRVANRKFVTALSCVTLMWAGMFVLTTNLSDGTNYFTTTSFMQTRVYWASSNENEINEETNLAPENGNEIMLNHGTEITAAKHLRDEIGAKSRLPSAIIIGVKKCGTRALLEYLKLHPEVRAPGPEPHFFDRFYHRGLDWYRQKMPPSFPGHITMEKTPRYFVTSESAERIYNMSKDTKLLLVLRDPVVRAISDFTQAISKHMYSENMTFRMKALRHNGDVNSHWTAISTGLYAKHLSRWLKYFDLKNIHFVSGEELINNPVKELGPVQDFLGLERRIDSTMIYFNRTRGFPCIRRPDKEPKCFRRSKGRPHIKTDNETLRTLYEFYSPHNEYLYKLINRNFNWTLSDL